MLLFIVVLVVWFGFGMLAYGQTMYFFQHRFPFFAYKNRNKNKLLATIFTILGPIGAVVAYALSEDLHGLEFRAITREESVAAHKKMWPSLDIDF